MYWTTQTLGQLCDAVNGVIRTGPFGSQLHQSDYTDDGLPVIMPKNIIDGKIDISDIARIDLEDEIRLKEHKLVKGDIVFARRGDVGRRAIIQERENGWLCGTGSLRVSLGCQVVDPSYLYYFLGTSYIVGWIQNQAVGATMPNLNTDIVRSISITYPPLPIQRKIAAILSAYDDLIENNTRRIKILEEMAQAIYREWFVHYRFPGYEQVKLVDSGTEMGMVPEGWKIGTITDLCDFIERGVTPKYRAGSGRFIINQKSNRGTFIDFAQLKELDPELYVPKGKIARVEDVLINSLGEGTLGRVHYFLGPDEEWAVDQHMTICRSSILGSTIYIFYYLSSEEGQARIEGLKTGGTNMTMLNISEVRQFLLLIPPKIYLERFYYSINSFWHLKHILELKNTNLKRTRDMLLPKLIGGELDMSELELNIPV